MKQSAWTESLRGFGEKLDKIKNGDRPIVIFGASESGETVAEFLLQNDVVPIAFCDNFVKGEKTIGDRQLPVISVSQLTERFMEAYVVISAIYVADEIRSQLLGAGFSDEKILHFTDIWPCDDEEDIDNTREILDLSMPDSYRCEKRVNSNDEKKVLMIAYCFPPLSGSGVYRSLKFAKYLPSTGWTPTVISAVSTPKGWNYCDESLLKDIPDVVRCIRVDDELADGTFAIFQKSARKIKKVLKFFESFLDENEQNFMKEHFLEPRQWRQLFSDQLMWIYDVCCKIEKDRMVNFDVVYTTSPFHFTHLLGLYLHRKYQMTWVADFRDEWTHNPYQEYNIENNLYHRLSFLLEEKIVHVADGIVCVSNFMKKSCIKNFGVDDDKLHVITNGYDEDDFTEFSWQSKKNEKFTIVYTGLIYLKERNLQPIFSALSNLIKAGLMKSDHVEFKFFGDIAGPADFMGQVAEFGLKGVVDVKGYVTHSEAIQGCLHADLLICLIGDDAKFNSVYTGKIFDYLRCGKPILAIAPYGGVVDGLLKETGQGCTAASYEPDKIERFILNVYEKWKEAEMEQRFTTDHIQAYERKHLTKQLAKIFCEVSKGGKEKI